MDMVGGLFCLHSTVGKEDIARDWNSKGWAEAHRLSFGSNEALLELFSSWTAKGEDGVEERGVAY